MNIKNWQEKGYIKLENEKAFDQFKYQNNFIKEKYDRIGLLVPKGEKAVIKEKAVAAGLSVNEYIYKAVKEKMEKEI